MSGAEDRWPMDGFACHPKIRTTETRAGDM